MMNEFFKSIFRTLGRICAYIVLGILAYLIITWFGGERVKADTWTGNPNYILVHNGSTQLYQCTLTPGGSQVWCPQNRIVGNLGTRVTFEWDGLTLLKDHTYQFEIRGAFISASQISNFSSNIIPYIYVHNGSSWVQATCDRNCEVTYSDLGTYVYYFGTTNNYTTLSGYSYRVNWKGEIDITNTNMIALRYVLSSGAIIAPVNAIPYLSIIDTQNDTADIINNANKNTQDIIDNQNENTRVIAEKLEFLDDTNQDIYDLMGDDSDADTSFFGDIMGLSPSTTPITNLITLPISILNKEISQVQNGTCSPWSINTGSIFNNYVLTFPCINPGIYLTGYSYGGYNLWQLIDLMICLFMGYEIAMLIVSAYNSIMNLDDTFSALYQPRHAYTGYKPRHGGA